MKPGTTETEMKIEKATEIKKDDKMIIDTVTGLVEMIVTEISDEKVITGEFSETIENVQAKLDEGYLTVVR